MIFTILVGIAWIALIYKMVKLYKDGKRAAKNNNKLRERL
tara:strand:+ start:858 stop:977 length:120 start_codon:yes stop_codon:yes gene_type:complete